MATPGQFAQPAVPAPPRPGAGEAPAVPLGAAAPAAYESRRGPGGLHVPGASATYGLLTVLLLAAGVAAVVAPYSLSAWVFRARAAYTETAIFEQEWRLLGATLFAAAAAAHALRVCADRRMLDDAAVQRLQLGFFWFALAAVLVHVGHVLFWKTLTLWGLALGAAVMAPTLVVPTVHLSLAGGWGLSAVGACARAAAGNLFAPRRASVAVLLCSLLTLTSAAAGLGYLFLPRLTLRLVFGYHQGWASAFLWQWLGAGLLFLFSAVFYTLVERGVDEQLHRSLPKALAAGVFVAALLHVLEFGAVLAVDGVAGRWLLAALAAHWALALVAAVLVLSAREPVLAYEYEYEPIPA